MARPSKRKGHTVPINSVPVDQSLFTSAMVTAIEPRLEFGKDVQAVSKDGVPKWAVEVYIKMPSRFQDRTDKGIALVIVTSNDNPAAKVAEGDQVEFADLTVGVMAPDHDDSGRIRGGKLFWQATGVKAAK
jgi:hypothetical protein